MPWVDRHPAHRINRQPRRAARPLPDRRVHQLRRSDVAERPAPPLAQLRTKDPVPIDPNSSGRRRELAVGPVKSTASSAILTLPPFAVQALASTAASRPDCAWP
jgi:hypothetical protein